MKQNEKGFIEELGIFLMLAFVVFIIMLIPFFIFTGIKFSNETVSGIAYNTTNDRFISGATMFSVRASEATYVNENTKSTYCLPPNSPYKALVNRAAADKRIKIVVSDRKHFVVKAPWTCYDSVTVTEVK